MWGFVSQISRGARPEGKKKVFGEDLKGIRPISGTHVDVPRDLSVRFLSFIINSVCAVFYCYFIAYAADKINKIITIIILKRRKKKLRRVREKSIRNVHSNRPNNKRVRVGYSRDFFFFMLIAHSRSKSHMFYMFL